MGKIKRGILGGFSGKVANVIGGSWKGIAYMRAQPLSVSNPNTPAQQTQRGKFDWTRRAASALLSSIVQTFWNQYASAQSGYNLFISRNIDAFDQNGVITGANFNATIGNITPAPISSTSADAVANEVTLNWTDNSGEGTAQATDRAIVVIYNVNEDQWYSSTGSVQRNATTATISNIDQTAGDNIQIWLSFRNDNNATGTSDYDNAISA